MASNKDHDESRARDLKVAMNDFIESPDPETVKTLHVGGRMASIADIRAAEYNT